MVKISSFYQALHSKVKNLTNPSVKNFKKPKKKARNKDKEKKKQIGFIKEEKEEYEE